jgi:holo-[acyl-carrier protein] synthase
MILGIGNDIIEIRRIRAILERYGDRFLNRIFTPNEQNYCLNHKESFRHFAGRFAAKEALSKAMGTGLSSGLTWTDLEILNDVKGKPIVIPSSNLGELLDNTQLFISISHCQEYATAFAVWSQ